MIAGFRIKTHVQARLDITYKNYIERILERYGKGKSFFNRSESLPLYEFFVPLDLTTQRRHLTGPSVEDIAAVSTCALITGSGGSGKSMMMRHLLVSSIDAKSKTPIFLELRQINNTQETIRSSILRAFQTFGLDVDEAFVEQALQGGQLLLLLDGFDEVQHSLRRRLSSEIQEIARQFPKNWIYLSSRPDTALQGWDAFTEYRVAPLTLQLASDLVDKLPFESPVKEAFIRDMHGHLFAEHESFLSNPLLLSIMLLTYGDVAHIPHKLSTFYSQAYEALFNRHDALKGGFQRERRSGLDIQDYSRAFAAFSLVSYDRREFSFSSARALEMIAEARAASMLEFDDRAFLDDAVQAVCLLLEEGLEISFAHRSFQEYFAARFIQLSPPEIKAKLVTRYSSLADLDSVVSLLWELDPYIVEKHYLLPKLAEIRVLLQVKHRVGITHLRRYLAQVYDVFGVAEIEGRGEVRATVKDGALYSAVTFAYSRYGSGFAVRSSADYAGAKQQLLEAFRTEFGDDSVPSTKLSARGPFVRTVAELDGYWSRAFLQELLAIEEVIQAKHQTNRESLDNLLALSSRLPRRRQSAS